MNWSTQSWNTIDSIYNNILELPFITELMEGTLAIDKFQFYIAQDSVYLEHFGRALALIAARAHEKEDILTFIRFAEGAIVVESALHESFFKEFNIEQKALPEPACHHYVHYLKSTAALDQVEVAMAAVLPCFWIYKQVGDYILKNQSGNNQYQKWIDTYAGEDFGLLVQTAIAICDRVAKECTEKQQSKMTDAFITASKLEYMFWDNAYKLKIWEIQSSD
ncbi:thiaminase II [Leeuwenhoekiella sp. A16]|uniref:thiaminase II n=1 Tax=Leeuwenhoekiella sp. A16 TaxID=3141462 RepID=UPI003A7F98F9